MKFKCDVLTRPRVVSLGIDMGSNATHLKKPCNFFIEISVLFWTFGFEVNWRPTIRFVEPKETAFTVLHDKKRFTKCQGAKCPACEAGLPKRTKV